MQEKSTENINQIIENLISIHPLLSKSLNRAIRSKTNLNPGTLFIMGILNKQGILSMSEIGCKLSMPKPHVTSQIDKLIAEEMVERLFDPKDRRIINIKMTEKGKTDFQQIKTEISQEMRQNLSKLTDDKLNDLLLASQKVRELMTEIMNDNQTSCNKQI